MERAIIGCYNSFNRERLRLKFIFNVHFLFLQFLKTKFSSSVVRELKMISDISDSSEAISLCNLLGPIFKSKPPTQTTNFLNRI